MASNGESLRNDAPSGATGAVLKSSDPVPESAVPVKGLDFDAFADRNITVAELVENLASVGFQATSIGQAVDIVNGMVRIFAHFSLLTHPRSQQCIDVPYSERGAMQIQARRLPSSLAILQI